MLKSIGHGVKWTYAAMLIGTVIQVVVTAATARLLAPEAFGLIAMANVLLRFGGYFAKMGVARALVQRSTIDELDVRAAFTSAALLGIVVTVAVVAAAPLAAIFFQTDDVVPVLRWLAATFVLSGMGATAGALLQRGLRFRTIGVIDVVSYSIGYTVPTLALALAGFGVWSLVAGTLGQVTMAGAMAYALTRHPVRPTFELRVHRGLLAFGAKVSAISFLEFLGTTLDVLVIGRFGTAAQLGLYNRAYMLASLPSYRVGNGIAQVLFPVLSAGRSDRAEYSTTFVAISRVGIKVVVPLGVAMALAAPEMITVVLGEMWLEAIPIFAILAAALSFGVLTQFPGLALESLGVLRGKAIVQAGYVALLAFALIALAAIAYDVRLVTAIVGVAIVGRVIAYYVLTIRAGVLTTGDFWSLAATTVAWGSFTGVFEFGVLNLVRDLGAPPVVGLTAAMAVGALTLALAFRTEATGWLRRRRAVR
jgi:lipopolysaccharide exporter